MIGRLKGILVEKQAPHLLVDVGGVGYEIIAPMTTFYRLPDVGAEVVLHTHFSVSETSQQLFGFISKEDRELFRLLIKVNGVGPKMAAGIMCMESADIVHCVRADNVNALVKVPGVGKKTAERLIIEMRDKLKAWVGASHLPHEQPGIVSLEHPGTSSSRTLLAEAESALIALGYKPADASRAVSAAMDDTIERSEDLIRRALKSMLPA